MIFEVIKVGYVDCVKIVLEDYINYVCWILVDVGDCDECE